jgi:acyl-CoA-dependent ceramide synthase
MCVISPLVFLPSHGLLPVISFFLSLRGVSLVSSSYFFYLLYSFLFNYCAVEPARYFDLEWDPAHGKYFSVHTQKFFVGLLMMLNVIMLYWFLMIVKLIVKLFSGKVIDDSRSDSEDSDSEEHTETS